MSFERRSNDGRIEIGSKPLLHKPQRLTGQQYDEIRRRYLEGETAAALATEFGVTAHHVRNFVPARERL